MRLLLVSHRDIWISKGATMVRLLTVIIVFLSGLASAHAQNKPLAVKYRLEIVESGSFFLKTLKELGTQEAAAAIAAGCAAFQVDCSNEAAIVTILATMALDDNLRGEEHHGIIRAPVGYEICKVKIDVNHASVDGQSSFSGEIIRTVRDNGLGYYAEVPRYRPEGHSVEADLYLEFVLAGTTSQNACWPASDHSEQAHLWDFHNGSLVWIQQQARYP
jgi:hypothetical protein